MAPDILYTIKSEYRVELTAALIPQAFVEITLWQAWGRSRFGQRLNLIVLGKPSCCN